MSLRSLLVFLLLAAAGDARAGDLPPGTPADVRAIMSKMQSGKVPTAAEMKRLQEWGQQIAEKQPGTAGGDAIPAKIILQYHLTTQDVDGSSSVDMDFVAEDATISVKLEGSDDYWLYMTDSSKKSSVIQVTPSAELVGHGSYHFQSSGGGESHSASGSFDKAGCGGIITSSGHGKALWPRVDCGGNVHGNRTDVDAQGHSTTSGFDSSDLHVGIGVPFPFEKKEKIDAGMKTPKPVAHAELAEFERAVYSDGPSKVTLEEAISFSEGTTHYTGKGTMTIMLRPAPFDLRVKAADAQLYEHWIPTDVGLKRLARYENDYVLELEVEAEREATLEIELDDVSDYPGLASNWPLSSPPDDKPDLRFSAKQPDGIVRIDDKHVKTKKKTRLAKLKLDSFDGAAFGKVIAHALEVGADSEPFRVPQDENKNKIADAWEKNVGVYAEDYEATWDEDAIPEGQKRNGDGLTLFEEYRGFVVMGDAEKPSYKRLSPKEKEVFVYDQGGFFKQNYLPYNPARLVWHFVDPRMMKMSKSPPSDAEHRWINTNTPKDKMYRHQFGMHVRAGDCSLRTTNAKGEPINKPCQGVAEKKLDVGDGNPFLVPLRDFYEARFNPSGSEHLFRNFKDKPEAFQEIVKVDFAISVMHEVGHHLGIQHHQPSAQEAADPGAMAGVRDCIMRNIDRADYDRTVKADQATFKAVRYCKKGDVGFDENGNKRKGDGCYEQINVKGDP